LRARRRRPVETLQSAYNDIYRLLVLAYPRPSNVVTSIVGRDALLDALYNLHLQVSILERESATLETVLNIASRFEVYDNTIESPLTVEAYDEDRNRNKNRHLRKLESAPICEHADMALMNMSIQMIEQQKTLQQRLLNVQQGLQDLQRGLHPVTQLDPPSRLQPGHRQISSRNRAHRAAMEFILVRPSRLLQCPFLLRQP
jgi:hypothetical protein